MGCTGSSSMNISSGTYREQQVQKKLVIRAIDSIDSSKPSIQNNYLLKSESERNSDCNNERDMLYSEQVPQLELSSIDIRSIEFIEYPKGFEEYAHNAKLIILVQQLSTEFEKTKTVSQNSFDSGY